MTMTTMLLVDDSATDRTLAGMYAEQLDLEITYAVNGRDAVTLLDRGGIDVVLTDLQMPEMNGLELVNYVRKNHAKIPVILMTSHGSEEVATEALRAGAASYVPKKNLGKGLRDALANVLTAIEADQQRKLIRTFLTKSEAEFVLGYDSSESAALIAHLRDELTRLNFCDESGLLQVSTALTEALANAVDHGNLELDSALRESDDTEAYYELGKTRALQPPFCDRRVYINARLTPSRAEYRIRDEGPGFDLSKLPDPTDLENLTRPSGRGVMLIRTFMDEIKFNDKGNEITMIKQRSDSA